MNEIIIPAKVLYKVIDFLGLEGWGEKEYKGITFSSSTGSSGTPFQDQRYHTTFFIHIPNINIYVYKLWISSGSSNNSAKNHEWHPILTQEQRQKIYDIAHEAAAFQINKEKEEKIADSQKDIEAIKEFFDGIKLNENM